MKIYGLNKPLKKLKLMLCYGNRKPVNKLDFCLVRIGLPRMMYKYINLLITNNMILLTKKKTGVKNSSLSAITNK
jgi:hypothetical protein